MKVFDTTLPCFCQINVGFSGFLSDLLLTCAVTLLRFLVSASNLDGAGSAAVFCRKIYAATKAQHVVLVFASGFIMMVFALFLSSVMRVLNVCAISAPTVLCPHKLPFVSNLSFIPSRSPIPDHLLNPSRSFVTALHCECITACMLLRSGLCVRVCDAGLMHQSWDTCGSTLWQTLQCLGNVKLHSSEYFSVGFSNPTYLYLFLNEPC